MNNAILEKLKILTFMTMIYKEKEFSNDKSAD